MARRDGGAGSRPAPATWSTEARDRGGLSRPTNGYAHDSSMWIAERSIAIFICLGIFPEAV